MNIATEAECADVERNPEDDLIVDLTNPQDFNESGSVVEQAASIERSLFPDLGTTTAGAGYLACVNVHCQHNLCRLQASR